MRKILYEPLFHFVLIGGSFFILYFLVADIPSDTSGNVTVDEKVVVRLQGQFSRRWLRPPTLDELQSLIDEHVKEEILYKEAIKLGLENDDAVVRRRLRQKMEFISTDLLQVPKPSTDELKSFMKENPARFKLPASISFQQVFFSTQKRGYKAEEDAKKAKIQLNSKHTDYLQMGDPSLLEPEIPLSPISTIRNRFGEGFAKDVYPLEKGSWMGPIASSYGYHLVKIIERIEPPEQTFESVRNEVLREWKFDKERTLQQQFYEELKSRYIIQIQWPDSLKTAKISSSSE